MKMRNIYKKSKGILVMLMLACILAGAYPMGFAETQTKMAKVQATKEESAKGSDFHIDAQLLPSDGDTYNIGVTVENIGADWEGVVRVLVEEEYNIPSAYDTALSLPQNSEKQFAVKVPKVASDYTTGNVKVMLLDEKSKKIAGKTFKRLLAEEMECLDMGILSDDYSSLTYLDMGGFSLYYYGANFPIRLKELNQDNLRDSLDALTLLVIDKYNTAVLTDEEKDAISQWVNDGGVLIVGTGSYAEDTWSGLADLFPEVEILEVVEAGSDVESLGYSEDRSLKLSQLPLAPIQITGSQYYENYFSHSMSADIGDGAVGILPYSLVELGEAGADVFNGTSQEDFVINMLEEISSSSNARYNRSNATTNLYQTTDITRRMLGILGNIGNSLNFGVLKFLVIGYVIFVGPILYLILRAVKKREWYWVTVPVTALLGIVIIFFAGRGFEVVSTKVYSVTTQDLSSKEGAKSYLYCYDASYKEWDLRLAEGYECAGSLMNSNYNYNSNDEMMYYHHIKNEGDALSFGIKPSSSFEDSYFYAGKAADGSADPGSIGVTNIDADWGGITGEISNNTNKDFLYFVVIVNDTLRVYENLPAGGKCSLGDLVPIYNSSQGYHGYTATNDYIYNFLDTNYRKGEKEMVAALAALGVGMNEAYSKVNDDTVVVCGVTTDWDKTVDDNCSEVSYGCLYTAW